MRYRYRLVLAGFLSFIAGNAYAGAWTQNDGDGIAIITGAYYNADELWNNRGERQSQPTYDKYELDPYLEYGLADGITIGTNLSLQRAHQDSAFSSGQTNWGLGDSEFFARFRLYQQDGFVFSAQPMIKLPSPEAGDADPQLGGAHPDLGMGFSGGYGFSAWGFNHYVDIDTMYRYRLGSPKNQVQLNGTMGIGVSENWTLMPQIFTTWRTSSPADAVFSESPNDDYNLIRLQLSGLYKFNPTTSLQVGGFDDVYGRNVGIGRGGLVAIWKNF